MAQKTKNVALEKFLERTTLKPCDVWAGEALEAWRETGPIMTIYPFQNFGRKKFSGLTTKLLTIFIQFLGLWFAKIMWQDLYFHSASAENLFYQAWKIFSAKICKISECHFWANIMLRQFRLPCRASLSCSKEAGFEGGLFEKLHFLFSGSLKAELLQLNHTQFSSLGIFIKVVIL